MIDAKELRIGNLIFSGEAIVEVISLYAGGWEGEGCITAYDKLSDEIIMSTTLKKGEEFNPIPITEEWLVKKKFKYKFYKNPDNGNEFHEYTLTHDALNLATIEWDEEDRAVYLCFEGTICGKKLKYIHEFQNLYFALTGEEL